MFAVPGWNIAAKTLVEDRAKPVKDKSKNNSSSAATSLAVSGQSTNSKKRKRDQDSARRGAKSDNSTHGPSPKPETSNPDRSSKRRSRKDSRKTGKITGANAEPVGRVAAGDRTQQSHLPSSKHRQRSTGNGNDVTNEERPTNVASDENDHASNGPKPVSTSLPPIPPAPTNLTPLQAKMRSKLTAARFRHLNETLYTSTSNDALSLFANSPDLFNEYHAGFSQQVKDSWPQNPVDVYVKAIKYRANLASPVGDVLPLPRRRPGTCTIADLGCGDAPLARGLDAVTEKLNLKLHSFDLHAANPHVTVADISALPLHHGQVDMAIFCLSLMGTNWLAFVEEAWRVLRGDGKGEVWVAEVKSRFGRASARKGPGRVVENSVGKRRKVQSGTKDHAEDNGVDETPAFAEDEAETRGRGADDDTDLQPFIDSFQRRGFMLKPNSVDKTNKMFVTMIFTKTGNPRAGKWKGMKWNGKEYQQIEQRAGGQYRKFTGQRPAVTEDEIDDKEEGKILKPCVYKLRNRSDQHDALPLQTQNMCL
ncbi:25S rRNA (adenine645-N1)-methyltransferase [Lithohypha guttulata]|nr:25S rRNA (adenine645-N1)-methyltransferase [Lithohypha guttulata]